MMGKLTKVYNSKRSSTLDLTQDEDLRNVLRNNIAFHVKYQHKKHSFGDFVMNRLAGSDKMKAKPKFSGIDSTKLNRDTLLRTCLDSEKLSQVNDSFLVLQKTGSSTKSMKLKLQSSARLKSK